MEAALVILVDSVGEEEGVVDMEAVEEEVEEVVEEVVVVDPPHGGQNTEFLCQVCVASSFTTADVYFEIMF